MTMNAPLRLGDNGPAVLNLRKLLANFSRKIDDSEKAFSADFTQDLDLSVRAFQQSRGLLVDGVVGVATYQHLIEAQYSLGTRELYYDPENPIKGDDVSNLQAKLHNLGFYDDPIDGTFGESTCQGLSNYQREFGIPADGVCGPSTIRALQMLGLDIGGGSVSAIKEYEKAKDLGPLLTSKKIILDPGGGSVNLNEIIMTEEGPMSYSDLLWDIAVRTAKYLGRVGVEVTFSRAEQECLTDAERAAKANASHSNLNISLRLGQYPNDKAHGVASFYYGNSFNSFSALGKRLAMYLQKEIVARTPLQDCRYHERTWDILRLTSMPSVQVDLGYITNTVDRHILQTTNYRETIAEAIVVSIKRLYLFSANNQPTGSYSMRELISDETHATF